MIWHKVVVILLMAAVLTSCGGGGSGGNSASTSVVTKTSQDSLAIGASLAICGTGEKPPFFGFYRP